MLAGASGGGALLFFLLLKLDFHDAPEALTVFRVEAGEVGFPLFVFGGVIVYRWEQAGGA